MTGATLKNTLINLGLFSAGTLATASAPVTIAGFGLIAACLLGPAALQAWTEKKNNKQLDLHHTHLAYDLQQLLNKYDDLKAVIDAIAKGQEKIDGVNTAHAQELLALMGENQEQLQARFDKQESLVVYMGGYLEEWRDEQSRSFDELLNGVNEIKEGQATTHANQAGLLAGQASLPKAVAAEVIAALNASAADKKPSIDDDDPEPVLTPELEAQARILIRDEQAQTKDRARAAIMTRDFKAADELLKVKKDQALQEAFEWLTLKGDRHYYASEYDLAIEPYEQAMKLQPINLTARTNAALAHIAARLGSLANHKNQAIKIIRGTLKLINQHNHPLIWAGTQNNLGTAYRQLPTGNRTKNIQNAIDAYESALKVFKLQNHPVDWARTQNNLGNAYRYIPTGDRAQNTKKAIEAYHNALTIYTLQTHPIDWAMTQNNLGAAYRNLSTGDRNQNLRKAIEAYENALKVRTHDKYPTKWAATQNNLGIAYSNLLTGDITQNLQNAIDAFENALKVYTHNDHPANWAITQNNLGVAYRKFPKGDPVKNIKKAIDAYINSQKVYTRRKHPTEWAMTQNNLGAAYGDMAVCDPDNACALLRNAISHFQSALEVRTAEAFPHEHARTMDNLNFAQKMCVEAGCES